jgi:hypothetical protein
MHRSTFPYELPRGYASDNTKDNPYPLENPAGKKKKLLGGPLFHVTNSDRAFASHHHAADPIISDQSKRAKTTGD